MILTMISVAMQLRFEKEDITLTNFDDFEQS